MILETTDVNRIDLNILIGNSGSRDLANKIGGNAVESESRATRDSSYSFTHHSIYNLSIWHCSIARVTSASRRANASEFGDAAKGAGMKPSRCGIQQQLPERQPITDTTSARNDTAGWTPIIALPFTYHRCECEKTRSECWPSSLSASGRKHEATDRSRSESSCQTVRRIRQQREFHGKAGGATNGTDAADASAPGRATGSHPRDSCTGRLRPLDFSDALCPSKGTPNPAAHRTAARVTRVFSVRPPRRYCQSGYSCLGCDQYGLDSRDDPDDDQLRRAIDWRMARIVRSTRKIAEAGIKRQLLSPEGINRAVFGDYSSTTVQSWFMGRKSRKLVGIYRQLCTTIHAPEIFSRS